MHRTGWAGLGWAGWLGYKVPCATCRKIPCPSAAAQRAVGWGFHRDRPGNGSRPRAAPPAQGGQLRRSHHPSQVVTGTRTIPYHPYPTRWDEGSSSPP